MSEVRVDTSTGNGSTGNRLKVFSNSNVQGTDITYTSDAINGDTFTINETGVYAISYTANASAGDVFTISLNA